MESSVADWFDGKKTYIAALGLAGLALYQLCNGQADAAIGTFSQALGVAGLRHAITKHGMDPIQNGPSDPVQSATGW
jgi:hypothetical protein